MSKQPKEITIIWRNENYGRIDDAFAFRASVEPFPSATAQRKLASIYKKAGFELHSDRQIWVANWKATTQPDIPVRLEGLLQDEGYIVKRGGIATDIFPRAEAAVRSAADEPSTEAPAPKF